MTHIQMIQAQLNEYNLDAFIATSDGNRRYTSGIRCSFGAVLITPKSYVYYTDSRFAEEAAHAIGENHVCIVTASTLFPEIGKQLMAEKVTKLGVEDEYLTFNQLHNLQSVTNCELCPAQEMVNLIRAQKSTEDINGLIAAQEMTEEAFSQVLPLIRPGIRERDISAELISRMIRLGSSKTSFDPIIVAGQRTSLPHGRPTDNIVCTGDFVTMDFGFVVNGWCSDMTRTVAVGSATEEMRIIYQTVLAAQQAGIQTAKAGVTGKEIDAAARKVIAEAGYGKYFCHGFGHGMGIEGHEKPGANSTDNTPLPAGAVLSAEPGIYIPGKYGVRIEDVIYLTETGAVNITRTPKEFMIL